MAEVPRRICAGDGQTLYCSCEGRVLPWVSVCWSWRRSTGTTATEGGLLQKKLEGDRQGVSPVDVWRQKGQMAQRGRRVECTWHFGYLGAT